MTGTALLRGPAAPGSACGTGHRLTALYVSPDGTYETHYGLFVPPYGLYEPPQDGHHTAGGRTVTLSADADEARLLAPTWQETARMIRPFLPGLPTPGLETYARALLAGARITSFDYNLKCPAPIQYRHDYTRALITAAREALSHGNPSAPISQDPGGTWEVNATDIINTIPAVHTRKQGNASAPARRPALRVVQSAPDASKRHQAGPGAAACT